MKNLKGNLYLIGAFTLAGTSVISAEVLSGRVGTFTITFVSLFFAILILIPICRKKLVSNIREMSTNDWFLSVLQAFFGIFLFRMFLLFGISRTSAAEAGILTGATPAITSLLAILFLKEKASRIAFLGICSTTLGIFVLQGLLTPGTTFSVKHLIGNGFVLCAATCESVFNILSRLNSLKRTKQTGSTLDPIVQTTVVSVIAMLLSLLPATLEHPFKTLISLGGLHWLALVWYGVFVTAFAFIFWFSGINRRPAYIASVFSGMMPLTSLVLSILLLNESAGITQWFGALLIMTGMVFVGFNGKDNSSKA